MPTILAYPDRHIMLHTLALRDAVGFPGQHPQPPRQAQSIEPDHDDAQDHEGRAAREDAQQGPFPGDVAGPAYTHRVLPECLVGSGCRGPVPPEAPVPLCEWHLAVASEFEQGRAGREDVLPAPCPLCGSRLGVRYPSGWLCAVCEWRFGDTVDLELPPGTAFGMSAKFSSP